MNDENSPTFTRSVTKPIPSDTLRRSNSHDIVNCTVDVDTILGIILSLRSSASLEVSELE